MFGVERSERYRQYLSFLIALVERDLRARYRRSSLGHLWVVLQPLLMMSVWLVVRSFFGIPSDGTPYVVFVYSGMILWTYFSTIIINCAPAVQANSSIIKKIKVPREIFLLVSVATATFDMCISMCLLAFLMIFFKIQISWVILLLPFFIALTGLLALSVGMLIAAIGVFKSDIVLATSFLLQVWMFLTPIVYPLTSVPEEWRGIYSYLNPFVGIIDGYRRVLVQAQPPQWNILLSTTIGTLIVFYFSWPFFRRRAQYFADVM